jgi:hypothetical protein
MENVMRNTETSPNETNFNRTRQYIAHADDVWTLGRWLRATEEVVTQSKEAAVSNGLEISGKKTK